MSTNPHTRNFFNSIGNPDDISGNGTEVLKIAITSRSFRYFIEQKAEQTLVFYGDYALHGVSTHQDMAAQVSGILSKDTFLNKHFDSIKVCWLTDFEIIPAIFFDESEMSIDTSFNVIMDGEANFIFEVPGVIDHELKKTYSGIKHYHSGASLIESLRRQDMAKSDKLFINIQAENMEIVCFDSNGSLRIYNRYEYKAYQDYIYFVLLVADEMKINREEVKAILMGEISQDSQLYEMTHRYFRNISFINQPDSIHFGRAFGEYPRYFNYPLYNL